MNAFQRFKSLFIGLFDISLCALLLYNPNEGYQLVIAILTFSLLFYGFRLLVYYFTMAIHMVGGKMILYRGTIILDMGLLAYALTDVPKIYVFAYLIIIHLFSGLFHILEAREARQQEAASWRRKFFHGMLNVILALICLINIRNSSTIAYIYSLSLFTEALFRISYAFRKTAIIYIP